MHSRIFPLLLILASAPLAASAQDAERIIALKADEQGASWYRIVQMYEEPRADNWRVQAIIYA